MLYSVAINKMLFVPTQERASDFRYAMLVREMEREIGYDVIMYRIHAFPLCLYISSGCGIVSHDTA